GSDVQACTSLVTKLRQWRESGNFDAVSFSLGSKRRPKSIVLMTLTVMLRSWPSALVNWLGASAAFARTTSSRGSREARRANSFTEEYEARSSFQTSQTP